MRLRARSFHPALTTSYAPAVSTYRVRQRWEIRARRPADEVIAYFGDSLVKTLEARIDGVQVQRRSLDTGQTVTVRADGFVIMFAIAPVRGGHPFRRSLRRRGVVDLTGTLIVSKEAADTIVLADDRAGPLQRARRTVHDTSNTRLALLAGTAIVLWSTGGWLLLAFAAALTVWRSDDVDDLAPMLTPPETEEQVTAVHLWTALCEDVGQLVSATNLVPALLDRG